jgi:hypothetical protein
VGLKKKAGIGQAKVPRDPPLLLAGKSWQRLREEKSGSKMAKRDGLGATEPPFLVKHIV